MVSNIKNRLEKLRRKLVDHNIDALLVSQEDNRYYLSGFLGTAGTLIVTDKDALLATDFRYLEQAATQAPEYRIFQIGSNTPDWFAKLTSELGIKRLGFEAGDVT